MTISEIRKDLKDIRYYFSRQNVFDKAFNYVGQNSVLEKISKYNEAICSAPPKLYDLYVSLYTENHTQDTLSFKLGYTTETISRLNTKLVKFFEKAFQNKED